MQTHYTVLFIRGLYYSLLTYKFDSTLIKKYIENATVANKK